MTEFDTDTLVAMVEMKAKRIADGHYTIMKFSGNYKACFGTPNMDGDYKAVLALPQYTTLKAVLIYLLIEGGRI